MENGITELTKEIGRIIIQYEDAVKKETISGKQATLLIMAINDIQALITKEYAIISLPTDDKLVKAMGESAEENKHLHNGNYGAYKYGFRAGTEWLAGELTK